LKIIDTGKTHFRLSEKIRNEKHRKKKSDNLHLTEYLFRTKLTQQLLSQHKGRFENRPFKENLILS